MENKPFDKKIWLSSPTMHGTELEYVEQAYRTNWVSTVGENIDELEKSIADITGSKYALALNSGTSALHLAVKLAGIKEGDKVICSDLTFAATVNAILYEKGVPVFVDSERDTWNIDPRALEKAFDLYPEAKAVMVVDLYGTPAKIDEIKKICDRRGATIIEDSAEALGSTYNGEHLGKSGRCGVISFNGNKIITGSSGGMLLLDNKEDYEKTKKWSMQSRERAPWYQHEEIGYMYRMSNVIAGIIRGQIPYLETHLKQKRAIYERYERGFKDIPVSLNPYVKGMMNPNFWLTCLLVDKNYMSRQTRGENTASYQKARGKSCPTEIMETLCRLNVESRPIWKPMHMQPIYKKYPFVTLDPDSVVDEDIFERGLCLPSDNKMTEEEQDIIIKAIRNCF